MNEQKSRPDTGHKKLTLVWVAVTCVFCVAFAFVSVPKAEAQSNTADIRRYEAVIQNVFDFILKHYVDEVDPRLLYEGAMKGMFEALEDPYSSFLTESDMMDLNDTTQGSFGGVGLYISKPVEASESGEPPYVEVASPIEDTPGWRAGINPGDLILEIDGIATDDLTMDEVLEHLRGVPGTEVNILIRRGEKLEFPVTLTRAVIEVPTVKHAMIEGGTGYLRITTFTPMTSERVSDALNEFKKQNIKSLVIDLRNNYGGLLQSAIEVSDFFLNGGTVVSTKSRIAGENSVFSAGRNTSIPEDIPIIVLINRGSASASEIVAGALKDRGRAYLVGEKSFGKGSVQQVYPIAGSGFKITTARYYTPSDINIDKVGIPPDMEVSFPALSDEEVNGLNKLITDNRISEFVRSEPEASENRTEQYIQSLADEYAVGADYLRRLIRDERNRTIITPVYDLEYDVQLKAAVDIFKNGTYQSLMEKTRSLKALKEAAEAEMAAQEE